MKQLPLQMRLRERSVFALFVPGANAEAMTALQSAGSGSGSGVVWLSGPEGSGKTHLLQAACAAASDQRVNASYISLRELASLGPEALGAWQDQRLLALDDVDQVAGNPLWERALFGLHLEVSSRGGALLLAARSGPSLLPWQLPDLRSRLLAAQIFLLRPLDEEQQAQALKLRAAARGLEMPDDTLRYLQRHFARDWVSLCRMLDQADELALAQQRRLTVPLIREVMAAARSTSD